MKCEVKYSNRAKINYFFVTLSFIVFFTFTLLFRFLLPFGSEPDFDYRVNDIINNNSDLGAKFLNFFYSGNEWIITCKIHSSPLTLFNDISQFNCGESSYLILNRIIIMMIFWVGIVLFAIYHSRESKDNLYSILLALIFPSIIYYLGVIGQEQLTLFLSLLLIVCYKDNKISFLLFTCILSIDSGSFILVFSFFCLLRLYYYLASKQKYIYIVLLSIIFILFSLLFGMNILEYMYKIPIVGPKAQLIFNDYNNYYSYVATKYNILLRPGITFMTGVFMTPDGIKSIIPIFICFIIFLCLSYKIIKTILNRESSFISESIVLYFSILTFILSFVFILPGFSNAKYYVFVFPFIMLLSSKFYSFSKILIFVVICDFFVVYELLISRLNIYSG